MTNRVQWDKKRALSQNRVHLEKDIRSNRKSFYVYAISKRNTNEIFSSCAVKLLQEEGKKT